MQIPFRLWFYSICSGILLSIPWLVDSVGLLSLFTFVPLLYVGEYVASIKNRVSILQYFFVVYIGLWVWTLCSVWWLVNSTLVGLLVSLFFYPLCMSIPFVLSQIIRRKMGNISGYFSLIVFWISLEWLSLNFDFSWPWLVLGNAFARSVELVQWYQYTGVLGGTFWILLVNVLLFELINPLRLRRKSISQPSSPRGLKQPMSVKPPLRRRLGDWSNQIKIVNRKIQLSLVIIIVLPIACSIYRFENYKEKGSQSEWVIVQPNIDSYTEKFSGMKSSEQISKMLKLADSVITNKTTFLLLPETAIPTMLFENNLNESSEIKQLQAFIEKYQNLTIICGAITVRKYNFNRDGRQNYYLIKGTSGTFVQYNSALSISKNDIQIYRKSKLLPGVETMPLAKYFPIVNTLLFNFGGQGGSFGTQDERTVFKNGKDTFATIICYESEFGAYVGEFAQNGAQTIALITNDGWWGNTPGYIQHLSYSRLRAIELRRDIPRSANTGISCLINQRGEILEPTKYGVADVRKVIVSANTEISFYAKHGDYIGKYCLWMALLFLMGIVVKNKFM